MKAREQIESQLAPINLALKAKGKYIEIDELSESDASIKMNGFCSGGCGCVGAFADRVEDIVKDVCPNINNIKFSFE